MSQNDFVHLKVHSDFSIHDGLGSVGELLNAAADQGMKALAVTDDRMMAGALKTYLKFPSKKVKPIIAVELLVKNGETEPYVMELIAKDNQGYKNLCNILSRGYEEGYQGDDTMIVERDWIVERSEGVIALSGARYGDVGKALLADDMEVARENALFWKEVFGDRYYIELQRTAHPDDEPHVQKAVILAADLELPVVATNDVRFIKREHFTAHQIRASIARKMKLEEMNENLPYEYRPHQYLKSGAEMAELFDDIPSAIENTVEIAKRCSIDIEVGKNYLPAFETPNGETEADFLRKMSEDGLAERLEKILDPSAPDYAERRQEYVERLNFELKIIEDMGFPGYFLIVADFIQWAKDNDIPVGPGRGSGAGSLVAYVTKITDLDPLQYKLMFERFLNPERVSMPDFDIDFCKYGRERVIQYVADKYGHSAVSQIITFGTLAARMVVKDVARALGYPYSAGDNLAKLIPEEPGMTLEKAMDRIPELQELYETDPDTKKILDYCFLLEGKVRQTGKHAGGVLIAPSELTDFTPTYQDSEGHGFVSQYDKNDVETAGLVKFDFLGLKTLTIIKQAVDDVNRKKLKRGEEPINIDNIDLEDPFIYKKIFGNAETTSVFQVESRGMKDLIKRLKPDCLNDIIALVALFRPGPIDAGMLDQYCDVKNGIKELELIHPMLEPIINDTYGVLVYQEQVMSAAQILAGYTLGGADMLRRAMGKKKPEEMDKQRSIFVDGCGKNGIEPGEANRIFDLIEKFAGYGFNRSHSAAYGVVTLQTAFLKAYYPSEFMAAVISMDQDDSDKVLFYASEARRMGLNVVPPDINKSMDGFTTDDAGNILFSLKIKNVGPKEVQKILKEREENGPFTSLHDYIQRVGSGKNAIESLIQSGAFDSFGHTRATLMASYVDITNAIKGHKEAVKKGKIKEAESQFGLFDEPSNDSLFEYNIQPEFSILQRLKGERWSTSLYVSGHPLNAYENEFEGLVTGKLSELTEIKSDEDELEVDEGAFFKPAKKEKPKDRLVVIAGQVTGLRKYSRGGKGSGSVAMVTLDDGTSTIECTVFPNLYAQTNHLIYEDAMIIVEGNLTFDSYKDRYKLIPKKVHSIDTMRDEKVAFISVKFDEGEYNAQRKAELREVLRLAGSGSCGVQIIELVNGVERMKFLEDGESIMLNDQVLDSLRTQFGESSVNVVYRHQVDYDALRDAEVVVDEETRAERIKERRKELNNLFNEAAKFLGVE